MTQYLRSVQDRRNAILNDTPDTKFYFESQRFSDIPDRDRPPVQNRIQMNEWGAPEVKRYSRWIEAAAARYSIDPRRLTRFFFCSIKAGR